MTSRFYAGTRKGLFTFEKSPSGWSLTAESFLGFPVPTILPDHRDGTLYAAVEHQQFGTKPHRSADAGAS